MNIHLICITQYSRFTRLLPLFLLGLLITGCGNKTLPKPISQEGPPQIRDLQAQVRSKGVELSWSLSDLPPVVSQESELRLSIHKSELKWENRSCLDCPVPTQQEVLNIDPLHPQPLAVLENQKLIWVDPAVAPQHAYRYQVTLLDKKGRELALATPLIAKVLPPPAAPKDLQANTEPQGIILHWKASTKDEHGKALQGDLQFIIERQAPGGAWEKVSPLPVRALTFMDPAVTSAQIYDYRILPVLLFEGTSIVGQSTLIRQVKAPDSLPPPPPKTVWVVPSKGAIEVQWTESEGKVEGYHVYRREGKEITRLTSSTIQHPPYLDRSMKKNEIYFYAVSAVSSKADQREGLLSKWVEIRSLSFE